MSMDINGKLIVDTMFSESRGTFRAASTEKTAKRLKLKVNDVYYDLTGERAFETFPLTSGSGRYTVSLYRQVDGKRYARVGLVRFSVRLQREDAAFLSPNPWVMYDGLSRAIRCVMGCKGKTLSTPSAGWWRKTSATTTFGR